MLDIGSIVERPTPRGAADCSRSAATCASVPVRRAGPLASLRRSRCSRPEATGAARRCSPCGGRWSRRRPSVPKSDRARAAPQRSIGQLRLGGVTRRPTDSIHGGGGTGRHLFHTIAATCAAAPPESEEGGARRTGTPQRPRPSLPDGLHQGSGAMAQRRRTARTIARLLLVDPGRSRRGPHSARSRRRSAAGGRSRAAPAGECLRPSAPPTDPGRRDGRIVETRTATTTSVAVPLRELSHPVSTSPAVVACAARQGATR